MKASKRACKFCQSEFEHTYTFLMHYLKVHFYCEKCDQKFDDKKAILDHQNKVHGKAFQCELCQQCFFDGGNLNSHKVAVHMKKTNDDKQKYYCDLCDFVTIHENNLMDHNLAIHLKKKDFKCDKCDFTTAVKGNLRKHEKRNHHDLAEIPSIKCDLCDYIFKGTLDAIKSLKSHMKIHEKNRPRIKCEHCSKEFLTKEGLKRHVKLIHRNERYKCDICHVKSKSVTYHKIHMRSHMPDEDQLKCDKCDTFVTNNQYKLTRHIKTNHSSTRNIQKNCIVCKIELSSFSDYHNHMREKHPKGSRVPCEFCSSNFSDIWTMKMHLLKSHFMCHKCDNKFETDEQMLNHMKDSHDDDYQCNLCPQRFFEGKLLARHIRHIHENIRYEKRFPCDICDYIATVPSQLKYHKKIKHEKSEIFKCEFCDHQTTYKGHLKRHVLTVHQKENLPLQKCEICEFTTVNPDGLRQHMATHIEKQFQCEFCDKQFTVPASLRRHTEIYHQEKLLKCDFCDFETRQKSAFKNHWAKHEKQSMKKCDVCEFSTTNKWYYEKHMHKHLENPPIYECEQCYKVLTTKEGLRTHKKTIHEKEIKEKVPCELCGKELTNKRLLKSHQAKIHHFCQTCDKSFGSSNGILDHMKNHHNLEFQCSICFSRHFCTDTLRNHMYSHKNSQTSKVTKYFCDICDFSARDSKGLREHNDGVHLKNKRFQCHLCDHKTAYKSHLNTHIARIHSNENVSLHCDVKECNYVATEVQHLISHKKSLRHQENLRKIQLTNQNGQWVVQLKRFGS